MKKKSIVIAILGLISSILIVLTSCENDEKTSGTYSNGVFIANEGLWGASNASVSFYSYDTDTLYNNIFEKVNTRSLGDVLQSITLHRNNAYLVVNSSNKVEVVTSIDFRESGVIYSVSLPRYMAAKGDKGYISCWGDNTVKVVDLKTLQIIKSIQTGTGPNKMLIYYDYLYVANSGGYGIDSTISVIDLTGDTIISTIRVGYNPTDIKLDKNHELWVLCYGKAVYDAEWNLIDSSACELVKIDMVNYEIGQRITISENKHASILDISPDGSLIYYGGGYSFGLIYRFHVDQSTSPGTLFCSDYAYGFAVHPGNGEVFVCLAPSFTDAGILKRFDSEGYLRGTYETGVGPNSAAFLKKSHK
jgi:YVTN family beta-propeller protein